MIFQAMTFTPEQIAFIDQMITERLKTKTDRFAHSRLFHSIPEIRILITQNIDRLKQEIGDKEFDLSVLRFVLKKFVSIREADDEWLEGSGSTRFDRQIANALRSDGWPDGCPIQSTGKPRWYRFVAPSTPSLFDAQ